MKLYRKKQHLAVLVVNFLIAVSLYAGGNPEEDAYTKPGQRSFLVLLPEHLPASGGGSPGEIKEAASGFAVLLAQNLGSKFEVGEAGAAGDTDIGEYALLQEADTAVFGFFLAEKSDEGEYFGRLVLEVVSPASDRRPFSLVYQGGFLLKNLDQVLSRLAETAALDILARAGPLEDDEVEVLNTMIREAKAEKRARRTIVLTLRSKTDPEARVFGHDGRVLGTFENGELSLEIPAESRYSITVQKPGYYTRTVEGSTETEDISRQVRELYPEKSSDAGFVFSYLRPFGLLLEARYRLFQESATLGVSAGLFPLPDYSVDYVFARDSGDLLIESELGFHAGWYPFTRADSLWRVQLELNMRINTYTNPYQDWRTLRALMLGPGLRFELNRPTWLAHIGVRGYYPNYTPAKMGDSGIVLINLGAAWKN